MKKPSSIAVLALASTSLLLMGVAGCSFEFNSGDNTTSTTTQAQEITFTDKATDITYFNATASMEVKSLTLGFMPDPSRPLLSSPLDDGNQFVRLHLAITNTGEEEFSMSFTNISLSHTGEEEDSATIVINDGNVDDLLKTAALAPGETVEGALYFEVPATDTGADLTVQYRGYDGESINYPITLN